MTTQELTPAERATEQSAKAAEHKTRFKELKETNPFAAAKYFERHRAAILKAGA